MISAILWDMDGVLVETSEAHFRSWMVTAGHFKFPYNREIFLRYYGMNNASVIRGVYGDDVSEDLISKISTYKEVYFRDHIKDEIKLLPGVAAWLDIFSKKGFKQAVASSGPLENINLVVTATDIYHYFSALVSCAEGLTKPDPWVFQEAARQLSIPPSECLVIEDTPNGVKAGNNADMRVLAVTSSNPSNSLSQADLVVENLGKMEWGLFHETFMQEEQDG